MAYLTRILASGFFFLLLYPELIYSQGIPLIRNIAPDHYENNRQNWAFAQDSAGIIYVGNSSGLLVYDGVEWSATHTLKPVVLIRSLLTASNGTIYYSGVDDFGYIGRDSLGTVKLVSLHDVHGLDSLNYGHIRRTAEYNGDVYFQTPDYLFKYNYASDDVDVIEADHKFDQLLMLGDRMTVHIEKKGLYELNGEKFAKVEGSGLFSDDKVFSIENFENHSLVFSREHGITKYKNGRFTTLKNRAGQLVSDYNIYRTAQFKDGKIAVATLNGGILIVDSNGVLLNIINDKKGLPTNIVYNVFIDSESTLWAALDNGISRIYLNKKVTRINESTGLKGIISHVIEANSRVYAGSTEGLYTIETALNSNFMPEVNRVAGVERIYDITRAGSKIIAADTEGIKVIEGGKVTQYNSQVFRHLYSADGNQILYLVLNDRVYEADTRNPIEPGFLITHSAPVSDLIQFQNKLWVLDDEGITAYGLDGEKLNSYQFPEKLDRSYFIEQHGDIFLIGTVNGLYFMNPDEGVVYKNDSIADDDLNSEQVSVFESCNDSGVWLRAGRKIKKGIRTQSGWEFQESLYKDIARKPNETIHDMECVKESVWFSGTEGVYILQDEDVNNPAPFFTRISKVYVRNDSLLSGGYREPGQISVLPYRDNELRFVYTASSYLEPEQNTYQVMLEGFDSDWSTWTSETNKDYTNIPAGEYIFKVRSKNQYDQAGIPGKFTFEILPPWYRTWWAYLLYLFVICGVLYTIHKIRINQILKIQRIRGRIASDLHDEVSATLISIGLFAEAVKRQNPEMNKNRFMNLIAGSTEQAKDKIKDIIWVVNPDNDDWDELIAKCRKYAADLLKSKDIKHSFDFPESVKGKPLLEVRQHFWLIYKELLTNAVRHSGADNIHIDIRKNADLIILTVEDDGIGFDTGLVSDGNGLKNLKKRAAAINAELKIESDAGKGTTSELSVPL